MKKSIIFFVMCCLFFVSVVSGTSVSARSNAVSIEKVELNVNAKSALLIDYNTETVIYEKNANERLPIASMTKLASLALVFKNLENGTAKVTDMVSVSEKAAAVGGSSAFLDAGSRYELGELVKSVVVASANDSTVALAEHFSGSEEVFVQKMNKFAEDLKLEDTHFSNSTGLPAENHYSSAYDMAKIYKTIAGNALYKKYSKVWMDDFVHPSGRKTGLVNTNRLVKTYDGIEGGKTGYTDSARFCLTASANRNSMRLIGVVIGATDSKTRFAEMTKMFNYGFANFESKMIVNSEIPITISSVKKSKEKCEIFAERDCVKFLSKSQPNEFTTDYQLNEIKAPLKAGDVVGKLFVFDKNNMVVDELNLIVKQSVKPEAFKNALKRLVESW